MTELKRWERGLWNGLGVNPDEYELLSIDASTRPTKGMILHLQKAKAEEAKFHAVDYCRCQDNIPSDLKLLLECAIFRTEGILARLKLCKFVEDPYGLCYVHSDLLYQYIGLSVDGESSDPFECPRVMCDLRKNPDELVNLFLDHDKSHWFVLDKNVEKARTRLICGSTTDSREVLDRSRSACSQGSLGDGSRGFQG